MNKQKLMTVGLLIVAVIATVEFHKFMQRRVPACEDGVCAVPADRIAAKVTGPQTVPFMPPALAKADRPLPKLIDFGSGECVTCKMMDVVLDELAQEYSGKLAIQFVDAREQQVLAEKHSIRMIPTQIFFDAQGKELFRHEGFISKEDILKKWAELGVVL
jgi:thioredoxin 1